MSPCGFADRGKDHKPKNANTATLGAKKKKKSQGDRFHEPPEGEHEPPEGEQSCQHLDLGQ